MFLALIVILPGCSSKKTIGPITSGFSCDAYVTYGKMDIVCNIAITTSGIFTAKITEPAILNGMEFIWNGNEFELTYMGIKTDLDKSALPSSDFIVAIRNIFADVGSNSTQVELKSKDYLLEGQSELGDYSLYFRADGFPIELSVPSIDLEGKFENIKYAF